MFFNARKLAVSHLSWVKIGKNEWILNACFFLFLWFLENVKQQAWLLFWGMFTSGLSRGIRFYSKIIFKFSQTHVISNKCYQLEFIKHVNFLTPWQKPFNNITTNLFQQVNQKIRFGIRTKQSIIYDRIFNCSLNDPKLKPFHKLSSK